MRKDNGEKIWTRVELEKLTEKVKGKLLCLGNDTIKERCPIGIIDFYKWEWAQGVVLYGMYLSYVKSGNKKELKFIADWFRERFKEGVPERNVNTTAPMLTLACVAYEFQDNELINFCMEWAEWIMKEMPRTEEGGFQHIVSGAENRQQLWDDTLFMTVLFLAKMSAILGREDYRQEVYYQFLVHAKYLVNTENGLWYHGWTFQGRSNFAKALWARGNSWITAVIPELIEILKPEQYLEKYLVEMLKSQLNTLEKLQAESGMWHTLLDDENSYEETSATAGFAYGILKGIRLGLLQENYRKMADRAVGGVLRQITEEGIVGQVSYGTGLGRNLEHYRKIPICPMAYGQSMVLMMLNEVQAAD